MKGKENWAEWLWNDLEDSGRRAKTGDLSEAERGALSELRGLAEKVNLFLQSETGRTLYKAFKALSPYLEMEIEEASKNPPASDVTEIGEALIMLMEKAKQRKAEAEGTKPRGLTQTIKRKAREAKEFFRSPSSTATNFLMEILCAGAKNLPDLPNRKSQINHKTKLEVLENGRQRQIHLQEPMASITIELPDVEQVLGSNKAAKKLFVLSLIKLNERAFFKGELGKTYISFPLQELIDLGLYSNERSAREGFLDGMNTLTSLKIKGYIKKNKKAEITIKGKGFEVLFIGAWVINSQCLIRINEEIPWEFMVQYFTVLPRYYFKLSNRAADLLYYIFYLARQNAQDIEKRGYFTINFRAIQHRLQLPSETTSPNPQRDIRDAIDKAIEELETEHHKFYNNMEFGLFPVCDDSAKITEYLDNGYLEVRLTGAFAKDFIEISRKTAKRIELSEKRRDRIAEKALAINTAKKLEAEEGQNVKNVNP